MITRAILKATITCAAAFGIASLSLFAIKTPTDPAPRFHATSLDGDKFSNDSVKGKVVLLQFWATWCKYCRGDQSAVDELSREYADRGLVVLAVNVGEPKKTVRKYLTEMPRRCPVVLTEDTNLAALFPTHSYPLYVLINRDGNIVGDQKGAGGERALRGLLAKAGLN
jgi:thiol-disulfide isomerase/thioredoxin